MFNFVWQVGCVIRQTGIIYCATALGIKMAQNVISIKNYSSSGSLCKVVGVAGGGLSSTGHIYRQSFALEDPVSAP